MSVEFELAETQARIMNLTAQLERERGAADRARRLTHSCRRQHVRAGKLLDELAECLGWQPEGRTMALPATPDGQKRLFGLLGAIFRLRAWQADHLRLGENELRILPPRPPNGEG